MIGGAVYAIDLARSGGEWNWKDFGTAALVGAAGGALLAGGGALIGAAAFVSSAAASAVTVAGFAATGAGMGVLGGEIGYTVGNAVTNSEYNSGAMLISAGVGGLAGAISGSVTAPVTSIGSSVFGTMAANAAVNGTAGATQYVLSQLNQGTQPNYAGVSTAFVGSVAASATLDMLYTSTFRSAGQDPYRLLGTGSPQGTPYGQALGTLGYQSASRAAPLIGLTQGIRSGFIMPISHYVSDYIMY